MIKINIYRQEDEIRHEQKRVAFTLCILYCTFFFFLNHPYVLESLFTLYYKQTGLVELLRVCTSTGPKNGHEHERQDAA